jgi:hypothetical protein
MSSPVFSMRRVTFLVFTSYAYSVVGPSRSERKKTVSPTHIGERSVEFSRGTFSIAASARLAIQIGVVRPPRYLFQMSFAGAAGMYARRLPSGLYDPSHAIGSSIASGFTPSTACA